MLEYRFNKINKVKWRALILGNFEKIRRCYFVLAAN